MHSGGNSGVIPLVRPEPRPSIPIASRFHTRPDFIPPNLGSRVELLWANSWRMTGLLRWVVVTRRRLLPPTPGPEPAGASIPSAGST